jgi:hypothetical protein
MSVPINEALWLVKNNVPFDVAFALDDVTRAAFSIKFSEFEGHKFNFENMAFEEPK